jgi:phage terminase large subunit-like protein
MLYNTATPKYYAAFREKVQSGEIPVCQHILQEMDRIEELIQNPGVYYDPKPVEGFIKYCETELTLTDGSDLFLLDSFKLWAEQLFGWWYFDTISVYEPYEDGSGGHYVNKRTKKRLINKQYLIVGRGAAKTLYGSDIQSYFLNCDQSATHQFAIAFTMDQAEETLGPIRTAIIRSRGPLFKFLTEGSLQNTTGSRAKRQKLCSTKKGIENFLNGSLLEVRPCSIDKLQGYRTKVNTFDEWLSTDLREDPITAVEQGAAKTGDYVIIAMSSEGTVRNGIGDSIKLNLEKILKGEYYDPHTSIWWYQLDDLSEINDPAMWVKANPNLGKTVSYDTYTREKELAEKDPSKRNEIIAKRFGIPMEGSTYYFLYEETIPHPHRDFWQMPCALGADLSQGDDFCAFTFLFPLQRGEFGVKCRAYISERTMMKLSAASRQKYQEFLEEGSLIVMEGSVLNMMDVYDELDSYIQEKGYDIRCFGYDPYNAQEFVQRWVSENTPFGVVKVIQGARTESVPLGELKQLAEDRLLLFDEKLMSYAMGNAMVWRDTNNNKKLIKRRNDEKIDPVAAMMDAYVAYKANLEAFD